MSGKIISLMKFVSLMTFILLVTFFGLASTASAVTSITFTNPTPANGATITQNNAYINTTISDFSTAFIEWNRSLIGWWRFNGESGENSTFFRDWSSWGNNGACSGVNCPSFTSGKFGNALDFDGSNDYVTVPNSAILNPSNITLEVWFNANSGGLEGQKPLIQKPYTIRAAPYYQYMLSLADTIGSPKAAEFYLTINGVLRYVEIKNLSYNYGQWHYLAGTYDGSTMKMYLDGNIVGTTPIVGTISSYDTILEFGAYPNVVPSSSNVFNGKLDEARIHSRALSPEEIKASYNAGIYRLYRNVPDLAGGSYHYQAYAQNLTGAVNQTEKRTLNLIPFSEVVTNGSSIIRTNGTTILVNKRPTFITAMHAICLHYADYEPCETSLNRNPYFSYDLDSVKTRQAFIDGGMQDQYKERGVFVTYMFGSIGDWWSGTSELFDDLRNPALGNISNQSNFFGYNLDEPDLDPNNVTRDELVTLYNYMHLHDPNHPVIINLCCINNQHYGLDEFAQTADIFSWDVYPYSDWNGEYWPLQDSLYRWEFTTKINILHTLNDLDAFGKPVIAMIQANAIREGDTQVMPDKMIRANVYLAIALGADGISFWHYNGGQLTFGSYTGLLANQTKNAYIQQLGAEIKSFEPFLLLPRTAYSWHYQQDYISVNFSNNPTKTIMSSPKRALNYRLIKDSQSNKYYLIVVNKDENTIPTTIKIKSLAGTGSMIATTLGFEKTGSSRAGRKLTVTNGNFTDSFDGYAAHIYQIS